MYSVHEWDTHIIILHQGEHRAHDGLQWKAQIGRFLGDFHSHPDRRVCRFQDRVRSPNSGTAAGRSAGIVGWGANGESDSSR